MTGGCLPDIKFGNKDIFEDLIRGMLKVDPCHRFDIKTCLDYFYDYFSDSLELPSIENKKKEFKIIV